MTTSAATRPPAGPNAAVPRHSGMVLAIVLVSYFMIVLDNSIIFTGLPQIEAGLGLSTTALAPSKASAPRSSPRPPCR